MLCIQYSSGVIQQIERFFNLAPNHKAGSSDLTDCETRVGGSATKPPKANI